MTIAGNATIKESQKGFLGRVVSERTDRCVFRTDDELDKLV